MTHEEIIKKFSPIIHKLASKHAGDPRSLSDYDDFVSVGQMAAIEAYQTLDTKKASLVTHAFRMINQRMQIERDGMRNISRAHNNFVMRLRKGYRELGEDATDEQLIKWSEKNHKHPSTRLTKVNIPKIKEYARYRFGSLDRLLELPHGRGEKYHPVDEYSFEDDLIDHEERSYLHEIMEQKLTEKEYDILCLRLDEKTLDEVGELYGVTRERIRQIEAKALRKLSKYFKTDLTNFRKIS